MTEIDRALAIMDAVCGRLTASHDYARGADAERARVVAHIREAAGRIMGKPFFFVPLFGFASPDDIPARPTDYGVAA